MPDPSRMSSGRCYLKHKNDSAGAARAGKPWGVSFPKSNGAVRKQRVCAKPLESTEQRGAMEEWGWESPVCPLARPRSRGRSTLVLQQCAGEGQGLCRLSQPQPPFTVPWFLHIPPHQGVQNLLVMFSSTSIPCFASTGCRTGRAGGNCQVPLPLFKS